MLPGSSARLTHNKSRTPRRIGTRACSHFLQLCGRSPPTDSGGVYVCLRIDAEKSPRTPCELGPVVASGGGSKGLGEEDNLMFSPFFYYDIF